MLPARSILLEQVPAMIPAWFVAETFYKFHSFTLECAGFLATWFVFDVVVQGVKAAIVKPRDPATDSASTS
jgi:hypothetical protein